MYFVLRVVLQRFSRVSFQRVTVYGGSTNRCIFPIKAITYRRSAVCRTFHFHGRQSLRAFFPGASLNSAVNRVPW